MSRCRQRFLHRRSSCAVVLSALAWGLVLPVVAQAQPGEKGATPKSESPFLEISGKAISVDLNNARDIWRSENDIQGSREERFKGFFLKKYLPQMTQTFMRESLPDFRDDLYKELRSPGNPRHVDKLNTYIASFTYGVARGARQARLKNGNTVYVYWLDSRLYTLDNRDITDEVQSLRIPKKDFHPAVRYNAMLWFGDLNSKPARIVTDRDGPRVVDPATPYAKNFTVMLDIAVGKPYAPTPARFAKIEAGPAPDTVRIAALLGLKRHLVADPNRTTGDKNLVVGEMLTLANRQPDGEIGEGSTWYRQLALKIVGIVGFAGETGQVFTSLDRILSDVNVPLPVRCAAADALGRLQLDKAPAGVDLEAVATHLAQLAGDVCQQQIDRSKFTTEPVAAARLMTSIEYVLVGFRGESTPVATEKNGDDETATSFGILTLMDEAVARKVKQDVVRPVRAVQTLASQAAANPSPALNKRLKRGTALLAKKFPRE